MGVQLLAQPQYISLCSTYEVTQAPNNTYCERGRLRGWETTPSATASTAPTMTRCRIQRPTRQGERGFSFSCVFRSSHSNS